MVLWGDAMETFLEAPNETQDETQNEQPKVELTTVARQPRHDEQAEVPPEVRLTRRSVRQGVVMAMVLGPPRSLAPYRGGGWSS